MSLDLRHIKSQLDMNQQDFVTARLQQRILQGQKPRKAGCLGCLEIKKNSKEYKIYLEYIKADILSKLGMKDRPRTSFSNSHIPAPVYEGNLLSTNEFGATFNKLNNQIIIIGEKADKATCPEQDCFFFKFKKKAFMKAGSVSSLQIWIYKLEDKHTAKAENRLKISVAKVIREGVESTEGPEKKKLLISMMHEGDAGWMGMDSAHTKDWVARLDPHSRDIDLYLTLKCDGCIVARKGNKRPFIVINVENEVKKRKRRLTTCQPKMQGCCRESLYVNFTEIGWHDWIVHPKGYDANYCRGTCRTLSVPIYGYVTVIQRVKRDKKICCSPKSFSPLTILYKNDNIIYKKELQDMTVEECGCS
eukprot:gene4382-20603_t